MINYHLKGVLKVVLYEPKRELKTKSYLPTYQVMLQSSHWISNVTGEKIKLSAGLKLYYEYRLQRFKYFNSIDSVYSETNLSCSNALSIGVTSISNRYNALLKEMGLLSVIKLSEYSEDKMYSFILYETTDIKGWLINHHFIDSGLRLKSYKGDKIDYSQLKVLEHNKKMADSVRHNKADKVYLISAEERREYQQLKTELKGIDE